MRVSAVLLSLGVLVSVGGCGDDEEPRSGVGTATTRSASPAPAVVTPADYALRAERRCSRIVRAQRMVLRPTGLYLRNPTPATQRAFLKAYLDYFAAGTEQLDRLARLTPPAGYGDFRDAMRQAVGIFTRLDRRVRRLLAQDDGPAGVQRVLRVIDRTSFDVPGASVPRELRRRAPACDQVFGVEGRGGGGGGGGGDGGGDVVPGTTLQA